jgi:two-component system, NtrC family, nitrogen regulation sensor histidine kinase NtrY
MKKPGRKPLPHDQRVLLFALASGLPALVAALVLVFTGEHSLKVQATVASLVTFTWFAGGLAVQERVLRPLQTASNLLGALREGDFSVRGRGAREGDPLGELFLELNQLSETLRQERLGSLEAGALLAGVMKEIDVAVFAFDEAGRAVLANPAAERLLAGPAALSAARLHSAASSYPATPAAGALGGRTAQELGLAACLEGAAPRTVTLSLSGGSGPFEVRRGTFRIGGLPHQLLVLADLKRALREEERQAWQRLVRVLGHEINNSLAPIHSVAQGLLEALAGTAPVEREDLAAGLGVVSRRAGSLMRFMTSYAQLARLPPPRMAPLEVGPWVQRVAALEQRLRVRVEPGPQTSLEGDGDQLDQLLINLVRNAADAALETAGGVQIGWSVGQGEVLVQVLDEGPGLADTANLFVPFFTTKPQGSGIGLALGRLIAEAHHGQLSLENRRDRAGCVARLRLPLAAAP